jgi:hypothetical protein
MKLKTPALLLPVCRTNPVAYQQYMQHYMQQMQQHQLQQQQVQQQHLQQQRQLQQQQQQQQQQQLAQQQRYGVFDPPEMPCNPVSRTDRFN